MDTQPSSDEELMRAYQTGDSAAFDLLFSRYSSRVYGFVKKRLEKREDADEVFQLVFSKLHQSRRQYDSAYPFKHWLFVLVNSVLLDYWRKLGRRESHMVSIPIESVPESLLPWQEPVLEGASAARGIEVMGLLSDRERTLVELRVLDEMSYAEISRRLGSSEVGARQAVSRALRKMRSKLNGAGRRQS